jgi:hypothetical protein
MDITNLVRAKRQCSSYAEIGYVISSFSIIFVLAIPALSIIVVGLIIASFSTTKGNRLGAILHSVLIGILPVLLLLDTPGNSPFLSLTQGLATLLSIGFILSLFGVRAAFTYHKLLPPGLRNENALSIGKRILQKFVFLYSGKMRKIALSYFWLTVCLLPVIVTTIMWIFIDINDLYNWFLEWNVTFWLVVTVYILSAGPSFTAAYYFHSSAKRMAAVSLNEAMKRDMRQPILLLRSFQDDLTPIARKLPFTNFQPTFFYAHAWTLEEVVEKTLRNYGPIIAIGKPGEKLPPAGASREYVANEEWQDRVKDFISEALLVVVIAGKSSGLDWEYQQLALLSFWKKLVILFPPVDERELQERWSHFQKITVGKSECEKQKEVSKALLATFDENGTPRFVTCKWRDDEECYRLAIYCGLAVSP